jgi:hypothetical protein
VADVIDPMPAHVPVGLSGAVADAAGKAVPAVVGALEAVINALIQRIEFLVEISFDVVPAGQVG